MTQNKTAQTMNHSGKSHFGRSVPRGWRIKIKKKLPWGGGGDRGYGYFLELRIRLVNC